MASQPSRSRNADVSTRANSTVSHQCLHSASKRSDPAFDNIRLRGIGRMVLPILSLCGAIPFDPVMAYDPAGHSVNNRVLVCCHCHVMESLALLDERNSSEDSHPFQSHPVDSLPDVVPRHSDKLDPRVSLASDEEEPDSPSVKDIQQFRMPDEEKSAAASWKQVGQELRRIADHYEASRRPATDTPSHQSFTASSSTTASSWIQTCILHGLVAYAGWRIQRWISG